MEIFVIDHSLLQCAMRTLAICFILWILVLCAILLDLWDGIYTARKTGKRIRSHILRITVAKVSEYWRFMLIGFLIDCVGILFPWYGLPYVSIVFFLGLVLVEVKSMIEHAKRRKSQVTDAVGIIEQIIDCASAGKAKELVDLIGDLQKSHLEKESECNP